MNRVENALKEYRLKYFDRIGSFDLSVSDAYKLGNGDKYDIIKNSFNVGFVMGIRYANKMRKALK